MARTPLAKGDDGASIPPCCCHTHAGLVNWCPDCPVHVERAFHAPCGLFHRGTCPASADVPPALMAPKCELCGARDWAVDHIGGDESEPKACPECAYQNADAS